MQEIAKESLENWTTKGRGGNGGYLDFGSTRSLSFP